MFQHVGIQLIFFYVKHFNTKMYYVIFYEYDLVEKILTIGFDNASANTASINDLKSLYQPNLGGRFFHVHCTCLVVNLFVKDGLEKVITFH